VPTAIKRYIEESERLYSVLEDGLEGTDYLVDNRYSVADINAFPWVRTYTWAGVDIAKFPRVKAWLARIEAREAVKKGLTVPTPPADRSDMAEISVEEGREWIKKADKEIAEAKAASAKS
jgi:glutathione S-transferase